MPDDKPNTSQKALAINLDKLRYGAFAEIGGGQEVARFFFRAGGASGTVAKTISAYDMSVSDAIYGKATRYVSRQRLEDMLSYEYKLLVERLDAKRGDTSTFFVYANTVATRSYAKGTEGHGWMGIRFQTEPHAEPSQILFHARILDTEILREQEAIGILGVNLIYSAFAQFAQPEELVVSLLDDLSRERAEVDMIHFSGPAFASVDNRLMALQLVQKGLSDAAMFTASGEVVIPADALFKKPALVERGSFRPIVHPTLDLLERAQEQFLADPDVKDKQPVVFLEMTLRQLTSGESIDHRDFLSRVDILSALGKMVLISNFGRYYRLVGYLSRYTQEKIGIALGVPSMKEIFDEKFYTDLEGGLLESIGRLCKHNVKLYIYPFKDPAAGHVTTAENLEVAPHLRHLYAYLLENKFVEPVKNYNPDYLGIYSREVLKKIQNGDASWQQEVPPQIVEIIKRDKLFSYSPGHTMMFTR